MDVRIVPTAERWTEPLNHAFGVVGRERRYIGFIDAPPLEHTRAFIRRFLDGTRGVQLLAVDPADTLLGWCDVLRRDRDGFGHGGVLGMALLPQARGRGLGHRLASATIERAWAMGLERIELEVFASNLRAIALYEKLGFVREGYKRRVRKLDGEYEDDVLMALFRDGDPGGPSFAG